MSSRASTRLAEQPVAPRRRLPGHQRRALILDAALKAFAANGYDGAAMDEIATAAGISKAVVYDHVPSKRELYTQLLHEIRADVERTVEAALKEPGQNGEARVRSAVEAIYRFVQDRPEAARLLALELQGANVSTIGRELEERLNGHLAETLGTDPGLLEDRPERARHLMVLAELLKSAVLGLVSWWYRHPEAPRDELVERTVAVVWPAIERARDEIANTAWRT